MSLWRIDPTPISVANLPHLSNDIAMHLRYAPLTTMLVQIGSRQQAYIASTGCAGCYQQRCSPDCAMQLLRRILIANQAVTDMRPLPLGLAIRPYTRLVLAIPGSHAQILDASILAHWPEARLCLSWRIILGRRIVAAVIAVGTDGPDPRIALRAHGWRAIAAQPLLHHRTTGIPATLPFGWPTTLPPFMLLPQSHPKSIQAVLQPIETPDHNQPASLPFTIGGQANTSITPELVSKAIATLDSIEQEWLQPHKHPAIANKTLEGIVEHDVCADATIDAANPPELHNIDWPPGPAEMPPERLGQLMAILAQSPVFTEGRPGRVGLAIPRLKQTLGITKPEAMLLLEWLAQAHLLELPINPQQPWRQPRQLATTSLAEIATKLRATPIPVSSQLSAFNSQGSNDIT